MLKTLVKKQIFEIFRSYFYNAKKNTARSKGATIGFIIMFVVIMVGLLGGMFTGLAILICPMLVSLGLDWLYYIIMIIIASALGIFGNVFNTYSSVYLAKDNEFLLSMPIPVKHIINSRMITVYLMGLMYSGIVLVPAVIVYIVCAGVSAGSIVGGLFVIIDVTVLVFSLSLGLGYIVARVSVKLKSKSFVTVLISLVFIGVYYFVVFRAQTLLNDFMAGIMTYEFDTSGAMYPLYLIGSLGSGKVLSVIVITVITFALFILAYSLINRSFIKIATTSTTVTVKAGKKTALTQSSVDKAAFKKEMARFTSSANYMLNCGLASVFLPLGGIFILIKGGVFRDALNEIFGGGLGLIAIVIVCILCVVASMNNVTAASISLEGKSIWIYQTLPIDPWVILKAKMKVQLVITVIPVVFFALCVIITFRLDVLSDVLMVLLSVVFCFLHAALGLFLNLKNVNLNWTNENVPIKQSLNIFIGIFGGWVYCVIMGVPYLFLQRVMSAAVYLVILLVVNVVLTAILMVWLRKKGPGVFAHLG